MNSNATAISLLRSSIDQLRSTVNSLAQIVEIHQRNFEIAQRNFDAIMNEIRGLTTESQRILEHLFGREKNWKISNCNKGDRLS